MSADLEQDAGLGDSSGSDGSLAKDLTHQAEINFALPFDNDLEKTSLTPNIEKGQPENSVLETIQDEDLASETEMASKYVENIIIPELMEDDCDSNVALMLCEHCHGPITKLKKFGKTGQQFCSKQCAESQTKNDGIIDEIAGDVNESQNNSPPTKQMSQPPQGVTQAAVPTSSSQPSDKCIDGEIANEDLDIAKSDSYWNKYCEELKEKAAPINCFGRLPKEVKGLKAGMKLEALDQNNPCNYCVATVIDVVGYRVRIRYDGFGSDGSHDFWCNFQADELFPIGWCAENSFPLQPPTGITSTLEDWKTFLTQTLTGALAAPMDLFRENEYRLQTKVHTFQAGMRVECIHPKKPSIICPATITKSHGPFAYQVTTEPLPHLPKHTFYGHSESNGIFSFGWTIKHGIDLALPAYVDGSGLTKDQYIEGCKARSAPPIGLHKRTKNNFKVDQKLEAVDLEEPSVIRVATVFNVIGRVLHLLFDGRTKFQYVDFESEDIYPTGWCVRTGHPLNTPYGTVYPTMAEQTAETEQVIEDNGNRSMMLHSFQTILGKNNAIGKEELHKRLKTKVDIGSPTTSTENSNQTSKEVNEKKLEDADKTEEVHCVFFNKSCLIGPYLDPEKVAIMPDNTTLAKPPAAVRFALEQVIDVAIDPVETMDAIQEGFCPKLFSKGKRKILKKGLFRFDTRLRAGRFLKRLCKKLKSCEYFLSFDPTKDPCPLQCRISGTTSLESFVTMKGMKPKIEPLPNSLEDLRRKRGRPRKDDFDLPKSDGGQPVQGEFSDHSTQTWPPKTTLKTNATVATPVRLINPTSYHGRPLVPIAPGSKVNQAPVSIIPSAASRQMQAVRPPPPYELNGRASFVQPVPLNTVVTSATQTRMVTPVNLRMISPTNPTTVSITGHEHPSTPTFATQNLATVLVVTKPHSSGQAASNFFRGNVPNHGLQLPLSPSSRKSQQHGSNGPRLKSPGTIKIHGPMIDQLPGAMNPKHKVVFSQSHQQKQLADNSLQSSSKQHHKIQPAIHIPVNQNITAQQSSGYDKETKVILDYGRYRDSPQQQQQQKPLHYDHSTSSNQVVNQYVEIRKNVEIKLEPQDHHQQQYQITGTSPNNHIVPAVHIHHPVSSATFHSAPTDELMGPGPAEILTHIPDRSSQDNSSRGSVSSTLTSPRSDYPSMRFEVAPHQNVNHHGQTAVRSHIPGPTAQHHIQSAQQNHLHVTTAQSADSEPQSALSPLHSPPPLRLAPANQHRSIALRSPPNLTPSTVLSHFDFSPVTTNTVISQPGHVFHHHQQQQQQQNSNQGVSNSSGNLTESSSGNLTLVNASAANASGTVGVIPSTTTCTVTLTYIPVKTQANDKVVYVPLNPSIKSDASKQQHHHNQQQQHQLQAIPLFAKQRKQTQHHYPSSMADLKSPVERKHSPSSNEIKLPRPIHKDFSLSPYSGVTRKFTVRTLQRDPNALPSTLTTVRIQGPNLTELSPLRIPDNRIGNAFKSSKMISGDVNTAVIGHGNIKNESRENNADNSTKDEKPSIMSPVQHDNNEPQSCEQDENFRPSNPAYEEISDSDEDYEDYYEDGGMDYDDGDMDRLQERKDGGFFRGGRKKGKRRFFVRRKGSSASHHYKMKYKQALEQAKFMRAQRPQFVNANFQNEVPEALYQNTVQNQDPSSHGSAVPRNTNDTSIGSIQHMSSNQNNDPMNQLGHKNAQGLPSGAALKSPGTLNQVNNSGNEVNSGHYSGGIGGAAKQNTRVNKEPKLVQQLGSTLMTACTANSSPIEVPAVDSSFMSRSGTEVSASAQGKRKLDGKGVGSSGGSGSRRKRKVNSTFENDFLYGQWMVTQDGQTKKKKRNSSSSMLNPTQYLADPLERVKLPQNPESWSESEVASFISATECSQYAETLKDQEIDGSALLLLTREALMEFAGMKLGPALKICGYVAHLKGRLRMHQNVAIIQS